MGFFHTGKVRVEDLLSDLPLKREKNEYLMDLFLKGGVIKKRLLRLYYCGIYLQATTLVDIVTGDGKQILEAVWK